VCCCGALRGRECGRVEGHTAAVLRDGHAYTHASNQRLIANQRETPFSQLLFLTQRFKLFISFSFRWRLVVVVIGLDIVIIVVVSIARKQQSPHHQRVIINYTHIHH